MAASNQPAANKETIMYPQIHIRRTVAIGTMLALLAGGGLQISQAMAVPYEVHTPVPQPVTSPHVLGPADRTGQAFVTPPDRSDRVGAAALPVAVALSPDRADGLGTSRFETVPTPAVVVRSETHTSFGWGSAALGAAIASLILIAGLFAMRATRSR